MKIINLYPINRNKKLFVYTILFVGVFLLFAQSNYYNNVYSEKNHLKVVFIDPVRHGQLSLVIFPNGKTMMVDIGPDKKGEYILPEMDRFGIKNVDAAIISHDHPDHHAGIFALIKNLNVTQIYNTEEMKKNDRRDEYLEFAKINQIPVSHVAEGDVINIDPNVKVEVLNPPRDPFDGGDSINNNAVVLKITYNEFSVIFPSDIWSIMQEQLLSDKLKSDVLLAPHHGHRDAALLGFFKAVDPEVTVISFGKINNFGYPHIETIKKLEGIQSKVLRIDQHGTLELISDGIGFKIINKKGDVVYSNIKPKFP